MKKLIVLFVILVVAGMASANILTNGDFEANTGDGNAVGWFGWGGNKGSWFQNNLYDGDYSAGLWYQDSGWGQAVDSSSLTNDIYTLTADVGHISGEAALDDPASKAILKLEVFGNANDGFGENLWWSSESFIDNTFATDVFHNLSAVVDLTASQLYARDGIGVTKIQAVFLVANGGADAINGYFDNAVLTPEPMTMALLGLGGLFMRRRRK